MSSSKSEVSFKYEVSSSSGKLFTVYENRETYSQEELDELLDDISKDNSKSLIITNNNIGNSNNNSNADVQPQQQQHVLPVLLLPQLAAGVEPSDVQLLLSIGEKEDGDDNNNNDGAAAAEAAAEEEEPNPQQQQVDNGAAEEVEGEYNADSTYKHTGRKEPYTPFGSNIGEGDKVMMLFATVEFKKLKNNFAFLRNADPLSPNTRRITLCDLYGEGPTRMYVNPAFWSFVIDEYTIHQSIRAIRAEERTNGWKKGGSKRWRDDDFNSFVLNNEKLPPKRVTYKPALGTP
jgi:hypothetical protein